MKLIPLCANGLSAELKGMKRRSLCYLIRTWRCQAGFLMARRFDWIQCCVRVPGARTGGGYQWGRSKPLCSDKVLRQFKSITGIHLNMSLRKLFPVQGDKKYESEG